MFDFLGRLIDFGSHLFAIGMSWFLPENLSLTSAVAAVIIGVLTLVATVAGMKISAMSYDFSVKAYNQLDREEPWRLTKLYDEYWLLERVHPSYAVIHGHQASPAEIEYLGNLKVADLIFVRGTKIVLKMANVSIGNRFQLFYTEHETHGSALRSLGQFFGETSRQSYEIGNDAWETVLY